MIIWKFSLVWIVIGVVVIIFLFVLIWMNSFFMDDLLGKYMFVIDVFSGVGLVVV